ncbi:MAG: hypothetical protein KKC99_07410 [Proteobacteria bacterium]|nr:hypothetical protein [Pseudomonadota bacterium]
MPAEIENDLDIKSLEYFPNPGRDGVRFRETRNIMTSKMGGGHHIGNAGVLASRSRNLVQVFLEAGDQVAWDAFFLESGDFLELFEEYDALLPQVVRVQSQDISQEGGPVAVYSFLDTHFS